jgi:aspartyl protease family protein
MRLSTSLLVVAVPVVVTAYAFPQVFTAIPHAPAESAVTQPQRKSPAPALSSSGTLKVPSDADGHFRVSARIGARRIPFLVDTGATTVALSWETGRDLGLVRSSDVMDVAVSTANGVVQGKSVTIDRLEIGDIDVTAVRAIVLPKGALAGNLLGMNFLRRLRHFEIAQNTLVLER